MSRRHRVLRLIVWLVGLPLGAAAALVAALVAAALLGLSIDASRWRDAIARQATDRLGQPVALQGGLQLTLGREPTLHIGGVRILNPAGFSAQPLLVARELRVRFAVFDALLGRAAPLGIEAQGVGLWLERAADGRHNWPAPQPGGRGTAAPSIGSIHLLLRGVELHHLDRRSALQRRFALDQVSGQAGFQAPLHVALRGRLDGADEYTIALDGGTLRQLQGAAEPWPFTLDIRTAGAALHANGALDANLAGARFELEARAEQVAQLARRLGTTLPALGAAALRGRVTVNAEAVELSALQARLGGSDISGQLALALAAARPRLSGALHIDALDPGRWRAAEVSPQAASAGDGPTWRSRPLRDLLPIDADIELRIGQWLGLPLDLRDIGITLQADAQGLRGPVRANLAQVPVGGQLQLDTAATTPTLALRLAARDVALATVAGELGSAAGIDGRLGRLHLRLEGRGESLDDLLREPQLSLQLTNGQLRVRAGALSRPLSVTVASLQLLAPGGQPLRVRASGTLFGEPATLSMRGGSLPQLRQGVAMPLDIELALPQAKLRIGSRAVRPDRIGDAAWRFAAVAGRSGDLARWLGVAPSSGVPVALNGQVQMNDGAWSRAETTLQLGRSEFRIEARRSLADGRPLTTASVRSTLVDVPELATLRAAADTASAESAGRRLDRPIFAGTVDLADADLTLDVQRLRLARTEFADLGLVARVRDGHLAPSPLSGRFAGTAFSGTIALDPRGAVPEARLALSTGGLDLGAWLRALGVARDIDGSADGLHVSLQGRGNSLRQFAEQARLEARWVGGRLSVTGAAAQRPLVEIGVQQAFVGAAAGQPVQLRLDGMLEQTAVHVALASGTLADFARDATRVPLSVSAAFAGTRLMLDGEVALPLGSGGQLNLAMSGVRLDTLNQLLRVELPAWGPWTLHGPVRMTATGYELSGMLAQVGDSRLGGTGTLDLSGTRPRLDLRVTAPSIQLDDFPLPQRLSDPPPQTGQTELRGTAARLAGRTDRLLSAGFLRRIDANIEVSAKQVLSGTDRLADGHLRVQLDGGRLTLDPVELRLPGGALRLALSYDLKDSQVDFAMRANIDRFDYGVIARRRGQADGVRGLFSLDLSLEGTAPSLDTIMRNANGRLDFAVWPTELVSGVFDFWSVNLLLKLLPLMAPGANAQVNCIVGRFDLKNGVVFDDRILIDTSAVRIRGAGRANLASESLEFVFRPRAKGLALFKLQTPLRVSGTLNDPRLGFERRDTVESVLRLIASPVLLPIEWFTLGPMQRDGADVCTDPLRASGT